MMKRFLYLLPLRIQRLTGWLPFQPKVKGVQFANVGEGTLDSGRGTWLADASTTARFLLYKKGTDVDHVAICGLNDDPIGQSDDQAVAGDPIAINILGVAVGTIRVVTDGGISDGDYVKCGATGQATKASNGDLAFGRAIIRSDCTKAAGDVIPIRHELPSKLTF